MIPTTQTIIDAIEGRSRTFKARFLTSLSPAVELPCSLMSLPIMTGGGGTYPVPGAVFASYLESSVQNLLQPIKGMDLYLQIGIVTGYEDDFTEIVEWLPANGLYNVSKTSVTGPITTFTAVGRITSHCSDRYKTALTFPCSISDVVDEIETKCGIEIESDFDLTGIINKQPEGTYMQVLGIIACLLGGFVTEDYLGKVVLKEYGSGDTYNADLSRFSASPAFTEDEYRVTGLACSVDDETIYTYGTPNTVISNQYMTSELFDEAAQKYVGYRFYPATVPLALGNPRLEPWDLLSINGNIVPCHQITTHFTGAIWQDISSALEGSSDDDIELIKSVISQQILEAQQVANNALNTLVFKIDYTYTSADSLTLNARVYQGGDDIHTSFPPSLFSWSRKTEDGITSLGTGYTKTVLRSDMGYGGTIVCHFAYRESAVLILPDGNDLIMPDGNRLCITY